MEIYSRRLELTRNLILNHAGQMRKRDVWVLSWFNALLKLRPYTFLKNAFKSSYYYTFWCETLVILTEIISGGSRIWRRRHPISGSHRPYILPTFQEKGPHGPPGGFLNRPLLFTATVFFSFGDYWHKPWLWSPSPVFYRHYYTTGRAVSPMSYGVNQLWMHQFNLIRSTCKRTVTKLH